MIAFNIIQYIILHTVYWILIIVHVYYSIIPVHGENIVICVSLIIFRVHAMQFVHAILHGLISECEAGYFGLHCQFACRCAGGSDPVPCSRLTGTCPSRCVEGYWGVGCMLGKTVWTPSNTNIYYKYKVTQL